MPRKTLEPDVFHLGPKAKPADVAVAVNDGNGDTPKQADMVAG